LSPVSYGGYAAIHYVLELETLGLHVGHYQRCSLMWELGRQNAHLQLTPSMKEEHSYRD